MNCKPVAAALASLLSVSAAPAALLDRGGGMIYDSTFNITWLADWNHAKTSGYDADGMMTWDEANTWAHDLVVGGYSDWRLPSSTDTSGTCDSGYGCHGSEMGHMFYDVWGASAESYFSAGANPESLAMFSNVQLYFYWSGTEFATDPSTAWRFDTRYGYQGNYYKDHYMFAVAVRQGDSATALAVPEAETWAMMLLGLVTLGVAARPRPG